MLRTFAAFAVVGFLLGVAIFPAFAESLDPRPEQAATSEARDIGAALGGQETASESDDTAAPGVRTVSVSAKAQRCISGDVCAADPESARRVLGALLASMGTREARPVPPVRHLGVPVASR
jgi:hypothetical protein